MKMISGVGGVGNRNRRRAELGRQPWLVYGLLRTAEGASPTVHSGTTLFTTLGFAGLYLVLGVLFLSLVGREISHGPRAGGTPASPAHAPRPDATPLGGG